MADKKISQLTTLAQADVAVTADFLPIVDTSATETKKATPQALVQAGATGATLPVALGAVGTPSYTFTGDLNTGMWSPAADTLAFSEGGVEAMRIDSSGNVGIGTASPGYRLDVLDGTANGNVGTPIARIVGANQAITSETGTLSLQSNSNMAADTGGSIIFGGRGTTASTNGVSYGHIAGRKENGTSANFAGYLQFGTSDSSSDITERMRLDSSGSLGLGVTPSASSVKTFELGSVGNTLTGIGGGDIALMSNAYFNSGFKYAGSNLATRYRQQDGIHSWSVAASGTAGNAITFTQAMTLTAAGDLLVGRTSARAGELVSFTKSLNDAWTVETANTATTGNVFGNLVLFAGQSPNNTTSKFFAGSDSTAERFALRSNGGLANYQANDVNLSDERTKKDIAPLGSVWDKFKAIEIVKFKYRDQTHDDENIGVIAQQVEAVAPEFVDTDGFGETPEDGVPLKTIYTADMYHAAIRALQEAMSRIEKLEGEVAALKGAK